jgi:hypothetical protein
MRKSKVEKRHLTVAVGLFAAACLGAPGGTQAQPISKVVTVPGSPTVYLALDDRVIYPFLNAETFLGCGFKWTDVVTETKDWLDYAFRIHMFGLSDVPTCEAVRGLRPVAKPPVEHAPVTVEGSPEVYYVLPDGKKLLIITPGAFLGCGLTWESVQKISRQQLDAMPNGPELANADRCRLARRVSFLVGATDAPQGVAEMLDKVVVIAGQRTVYFVTSWGVRHPFSNPEAFLGCGFQWSQVQTVSPLPLFYLTAGTAFASAAECKPLRD